MTLSKTPLISIAMCTYNGEKYLRKQLDSLVNQTYPHVEISIFDDCSSDGTIAIILEYIELFPQIKLKQNPNYLLKK